MVLVIGFAILPLDREVSPLWRADEHVKLEDVDELDLRYEYFWSRITFSVDSLDIGSRWGSVPLLDFVASIKRVATLLTGRQEAELTFTENSAVISFMPNGETVKVEDAASRVVLICNLQELVNAVRVFLEKVHTDLVKAYPQIRNNKFFQKLMLDPC